MNQTEIETRLGRAIGAVAEIPAGYALLGRGDGVGVIVSSFPNRTVYIFGTNVAGEAKLAQNINITSFNNTDVNRTRFEGLRVKLGYPNYDPLVLYVTAYDSGEGMTALNGMSLNEEQTANAQFPDVGKIINLRLSPNNPTDLNIFVGPSGYYDISGAWHWFGGDGLDDDFTTDIAALSGTHQMAVVYLNTATGNLGRVLSTAVAGGSADKDTLDAATIAALTFAAGYILCGAVHLYAGQTAIVEADIYRSNDPRVLFPTPLTSYATLTTTDATQSTLASIAVTELQMMTITATINGVKSDYSASCGGTLTAVVRRATAGNVTLVGSVTADVHEDSAGSPTFTLDVNTGTQSARVRVTGIVAESWLWSVKYSTLVT